MSDNFEKAFFSQRLVAFLVDIFIVTFLVSIISSFFVDSKKIEKLEKEGIEIVQKINSDGADVNAIVDQYADIYYKIARSSGLISITTILFEVLYFVIYQFYRNGQTLGKKLAGIRVVSLDEELTMNQLIYRSMLSSFMIFQFISFIFMLFTPKSLFFPFIVCLNVVEYLTIIISVIMIFNKKTRCALHDKLAHTIVIQDK